MTKDKLISLNLVLLEYSLYGFAIAYPYSVKLANASMMGIWFFALLSSPFPCKIKRLKENNGLLLLPLYFLLICIGVLYSKNVPYGLTNMERLVSFLFTPLLLGTGENISRRILKRAGWVLTLNTVFAALYCLFQNVLYFRANEISFSRFFDWEYSYEHLADFISLHPTYFSILVLISIYMVIFQSNYKSIAYKVVNGILLGFLFVFLILLGSKIAVLILFVFSNVALIIYIRRRRKLSLLIGYISLNLLMVTVALKTHVIYWRFRMAYETLKNTLNGSELSDYRFLHWKCATKAVLQKPIFGWGTGDSLDPLNECYKDMKMNELVDYNAHNQFLETWLKIGLPGLLITSLCLVYPLYITIRNRHYLFTSIFSTYVLIAFTESIFSVQKGIALHCLITSIYLGHICSSQKQLKGASI